MFSKEEDRELVYREYVIPKKGGKTRKIVAPSKALKKHQREFLPTLDALFEKEIKNYQLDIANIFHGFVKHKNCVTAAKAHIGYKLTLMMDIKHFFDSVQINYLPVEFKLPYTLFHKEGYAAQGFPSSPMLANIAIVPVMDTIFTDIVDLTNGDCVITIYADDIQVSLNDSKYEEAVKVIVSQAFHDHGYLINVGKTRVRYAKHGWRRILGVNVGKSTIRATRKTMRKIRAAKHNVDVKKGGTLKKKAARSLGGLTTWSKCTAPKYSGVLKY